MHLFKSFIQDLDTSLSALPDNIELILLSDFNANFTGSIDFSIILQGKRSFLEKCNMESTQSIQIISGFGILANENLILSHVITE